MRALDHIAIELHRVTGNNTLLTSLDAPTEFRSIHFMNGQATCEQLDSRSPQR